MNFRVLGWISVALAVIASSPYWLRALNKWTFKTRDKRFLNLIKHLRPIHKAAGILLAATALVHGWMALGGRITLHTGLLVYLGFLLTVILGIAFFYAKDRRAFKGHKVMALAGFLLFLLHLVRPWALGEWFGIW
ncbi:MAG: hypothetical protein PHP02_05315 [Eubacteriales bacterium]|nr:hypothetical protein [Eubacteriales bacterium]